MTSVPEFLGPYRIVRPLGAGGMSRLFLADRVRDFKQQVVIKFGDTAEGNFLGQLRHEHIVQLLGSGTCAQGDYLVLEYVDGVAVDEYCRTHGSSLDQRLELLEQLLSGVGFAHRHLIVHADLKPSNVLVTNGVVKVLDFGIAQRSGSQGTAFYTPLYASPEQREGKALSAATDVFLLGKLGAELLAPVFKSGLRGDLKAIIEKATAVTPEERYVSVEAMREDIRRARLGEVTSARAWGLMERAWRWIYRRPLPAAGLAMLALIVVVGVWEIVVHHAQTVKERQLADRQLHELVRLNGVLSGELYSAMESLEGASEARVKLQRAALETLDAVAPNARDAELRVELAKQYLRIAKLQRSDRLDADAASTASRGLRVLNSKNTQLKSQLERLTTAR